MKYEEKLAKVLKLIEDKSIEEAPRSDFDVEDEFFNAYDASGGNSDDAFDMGVTEGEVSFARELQNILNGDGEED